MKTVIIQLVLMSAVVTSSCAGINRQTKLLMQIDWKKFLSRHDLVWERMPENWREASFLGNGMIGTMIYKGKGNFLRLDVGRSDVQDHRDASYGTSMFSRPRLPVGYFALETVGKIQGGTMRLDLWNAETRGRVTTDKGCIDFRTIVHTDEMVIIVELEPSEGERGCRWRWHAAKADSPRQIYGLKHNEIWRAMKDYKSNPSDRLEKIGAIDVCVQPLLVGGQTATAWQEVKQAQSRTLLVSIAHSWPKETAKSKAAATVKRVAGMKRQKLIESHRVWWHDFYPASFISLPDTRLESLYWIQMYKLASATRADRALIDLLGPWLTQPTAWPGAWWNLNVQLNYWPVYASNRLELGESLCRTLDRNFKNLINNAPEPYRHDSAAIGTATSQDLRSPVAQMHSWIDIGNLPWACHNYWLQYRFSMDDKLLRQGLYPLLRRSINLYFHYTETGKDGRFHLKKTFSPEYGSAPDCNFDLALFRWGCRTLIQICRRLKINDPLLPQWQELLDKLTDYPVNENGYMIGRDEPFAKGHRHFSHLLMGYPLYLVNIDQPGSRELIKKTLDHWQSLGQMAGFSWPCASSICASLGNGNDALQYLNRLTRSVLPNTFHYEEIDNPLTRLVLPNTFYEETENPVIETPLAAAQSIHDMLIQSWGDKIRVFPAVPDAWQDAVIDNLRTEGAFLVSAVRKHGRTQFVRVKSLAGEPCRIKTDLKEPLQMISSREIALKSLSGGVVEINLRKDEEVILYSAGTKPDLVISPLPAQRENCNYYGLRSSD